jgi:hypothetical protein
MTNRTATAAPDTLRTAARQAGILYLLFALVAIFNEFLLPTFVVSGDAAATAANIASAEFAYRFDILSGFVTHILFICLVVCLYQLLKDVDRRQAMLMVLFVALGVGVALVNLLNKFAPLILLSGAGYLSVFSKPQLDALALGFLRLHSSGLNLSTAFWGLWLFPFGILVIRSGFFPRVLGILLFAAGFAYLTVSLTTIVLPAYRPIVSQFMTPLYFGEVPIIIWLVVKGAAAPLARARLSPAS